jgi:hypothetical protein
VVVVVVEVRALMGVRVAEAVLPGGIRVARGPLQVGGLAEPPDLLGLLEVQEAV